MTAPAILISEVPRSLRVNFAAGIPVMLKGASGIGKTELAEAYARAQGPDYGYFELNCATASLPDLIGLQMPHEESHVGANGESMAITSSRFAYPYFMRDKFTGRPAFTYQRGMVVFEEYGQATQDVKRALGQIIRERRNGEHHFPENTDMLLLSNRPEDRSGVSKDFDFLINRRCEVTVESDLDGWLVWAHAHGVSNMSMAYAARNTDKVFANRAPEKQGPWLTPRSLVMADNFLKEAFKDRMSLDDPLLRKNLNGMISEGTTHEYIAFARIRDKLPSLQSILQDPDNADVPDQPDQQMFISFDLASKVTKDNIKPITTYMGRLPNDFSVAFYRNALHRDESLFSTKEFGDWAVENMQLFQAVNSRARVGA